MVVKINENYKGIFKQANKKFGFVKIIDDDLNPIDVEVYIDSKNTFCALDDDIVIVKIDILPSLNNNAEGKIIKIVERKSDTVVGIFNRNKNFGFVTPLNTKIPFDIHIEKKFCLKAVNDSIVVCKLLSYNDKKRNPEGMILEIIGHKNDPNAQILSIVRQFKIRDTFTKEILNEASAVAKDICVEDLLGRKDLRNIITITIDGEDAKDLDDAISLINLENGNKKLYVSIADVSYYVKDGSLMDEEAKKRGNSVYLLDRVIPMLPHVLCNGICSLNEGEDRLTKTCEIEFDKTGKVVDYDIYESVINSNMRMSYNGTHAILNDLPLTNGEDRDKYEKYKELLKDMYNLSLLIRKKREERGSIDFEFKETKILVDKNLKPISISEYERLETHKMIEDFMLIANEIVAKDFYYRKIPFIYRVHENCDEEKIKTLMIYLLNYGLIINVKNKIHPNEIQKLLKKIKGKSYQYVIEKLILRSMKQARYDVECLGHFALSAKFYTHFTSPIRRYSDLMIHRIIGEVLHNELTDLKIKNYDKKLPDITKNISLDERKAIDCERDINKLKMCEYMCDHIDESFEGHISGITNYGIFVELDNTIEGMISIKSLLDDYYIFNEQKLELEGINSHKIYSLGQKLIVKVYRVEPEIRYIDFLLEKEIN